MSQQVPTKTSARSDADSQAISAAVDTFQQANDATRSDLRAFLKQVPQQLRTEALAQLVRTDFEQRWARGKQQRVKQYLDEYPEIQELRNFVLALLQAEYDLRSGAGEQPSEVEYRDILPSFVPRDDSTRAIPDTAPYAESSPAASSAAPETPSSKRIGRYAITRQLGAGTFGVVYEGYDEDLRRSVAIKVRRARSRHPGLSADQLHEARSVSQLGHEGIVKVYEAGTMDDGSGYVVFEFIQGDTLESRIKRRDYSIDQAGEWVARIGEALHYAHKHNVIHRDIKPANILIDPAGNPKVCDFGLARHDDEFFVDDAGRLLGTAAYMSPEQANGESHWASSQSDLYSLGVVLYELLCHKRPFQGAKLNDLLEQVKHRTPPPPRSIEDKIPKSLEDVCLKAISKDPASRYRTGAEMAAAVRKALHPPAPGWLKLVQSIAVLVGIVALSVLVASFVPGSKQAQPTETALPTVRVLSMFVDGEPIRDRHQPLTASDAVELQAFFDTPAFAYAILYDQNRKGKLLWPSEGNSADLQAATDIHLQGLSVPDTDGAALFVVLGSDRALEETELDRLLDAELKLGVSPEMAANERPYFWISYYNSPKIELNWPPVRASGLHVPKPFKETLESIVDTYAGYVVSHKKTSDKAGE